MADSSRVPFVQAGSGDPSRGIQVQVGTTTSADPSRYIPVEIDTTNLDPSRFIRLQSGTGDPTRAVYYYQQLAITGVGSVVSGTNITVTWTSAPAAYSRVQWGTSSGVYTSQVDEVLSLVTSHSVELDASDGIVAATTYYYRVGSSLDGTTWTYSTESTFATA